MNESGVTILLGTDSGGFVPEGSLPSHIHRELELLVEAGFSNYEALSAGTKNAGQIVNRMGSDGNFGTIVVGKRADFLLLSENPLLNVSATRDRVGVMVNGYWLPQVELDEMMEKYISSVSNS